MVKINWSKDYKREFQCPECELIDMRLDGHDKKIRRFRCPNCSKSVRQLYFLSQNHFSNFLAGYGLACPNKNCNVRQI